MPERSLRERLTPYFAVAAGAFLIVSGASILLKSDKLWQRPVSSTQAAPQRDSAPTSLRGSEPLKIETSMIERVKTETAPKAALAPTSVPPTVTQSAPTREDSAASPTPEYFHARVLGLQLRAGPGTQYKTFGRAESQERFQVVGHRGDWNRIQLDGSRPGVPYAWVRRDLIERASSSPSGTSGN